jgi:cytosine/adenosine deaminase-related metal-dependent hydrolase
VLPSCIRRLCLTLDLLRLETVRNSPEDLDSFGALSGSIPIVFSHASFLTAAGATLLRSTDQYISITPESEMHYGHTHPVSHLIQDQAALGVDTHFTFSTDILTQARIWLQSVRYTLYKEVIDQWKLPSNDPMSVNQAFLLATRHGGLALRRPDLGVIAPGAKADLVVWDGRSPALLGWTDPVAAVILHASVADIEHVLVDGEFVKRNRNLVVPDYAKVQDRFLESAQRIQGVWKKLPLPPPGDVFISGFEIGTALTADVQRGNGTGYGPNFF